MSHSVRRHLRVEIGSYDEAIRRFIPGYEDMLEVAASEVAATSPALVLDLGAGTGALSQALLLRPEVGTVELLDADPEMLDQARERLARFGERARFRVGSFDDPLPRCGAVVASLALHHVPAMAAKQVLYRRIFEAIQPGDGAGPGRGVRRVGRSHGGLGHRARPGVPPLRRVGRRGHLLRWRTSWRRSRRPGSRPGASGGRDR